MPKNDNTQLVQISSRVPALIKKFLRKQARLNGYSVSDELRRILLKDPEIRSVYEKELSKD